MSALYGLRISSPWPLGEARRARAPTPELELVEATAPLGVPLPESWRAREDWFRHLRLDDGSDYLRWTGLAEFLVAADGRRIVCHALDACPREMLQTYLLGQVVSFALVRRGIEPLHATAVVLDGRAVAFVGDCGIGKSSLGAAFLADGAHLLTDDLLVLEPDGAHELAHPGPARIKLFPHVAGRVLPRLRRGARLNRGTAKLVIPLGTRASQRARSPVPLRAIYVLRPRREPRQRHPVVIRALSARGAFLALLHNTFNPVVDDPARQARLFLWAARLAASVPIRSLSYPRRLNALPLVTRAIRDEISA